MVRKNSANPLSVRKTPTLNLKGHSLQVLTKGAPLPVYLDRAGLLTLCEET